MSITSGAVAEAAAGVWGARGSSTTSTSIAAIGVSERVGGGQVEGGTTVDEVRSARCTASGWRLRVACTDGSSAAICPACGQRVGASPDPAVGPGVWVIQEHGA